MKPYDVWSASNLFSYNLAIKSIKILNMSDCSVLYQPVFAGKVSSTVITVSTDAFTSGQCEIHHKFLYFWLNGKKNKWRNSYIFFRKKDN